MAAERFGTEHHEITMTARDFFGFLPEYARHMEEPVFEPPAIALYFVSRLARESGVKVLLSGEGGDEAFGGYQTYRNLMLLERLKTLFGPAKGLLRLGLQAIGNAGGKRVGRFSRLVDLPMSEYYLSRTATPGPALQLKDLYTREFVRTLGNERPERPTRDLFARLDGKSPLDCMLYVDTKSWLPDDLLVKADKMTMATSVELRVPLLDSNVLEFAASLPASFKVRGWTTKRILKAALEKSVPQKIIKRRKTGFPVPYDKWLRENAREFAADTLLGPDPALRSWFSMDKIKALFAAHERGEEVSQEVFCLLVLELLVRQLAGERRGKAAGAESVSWTADIGRGGGHGGG
jgi:asparagine synthase (glutamine-hydrolysing)